LSASMMNLMRLSMSGTLLTRAAAGKPPGSASRVPSST